MAGMVVVDCPRDGQHLSEYWTAELGELKKLPYCLSFKQSHRKNGGFMNRFCESGTGTALKV